jgi:universal stress protein E
MRTQIKRILVAIGDLRRAPRSELRKAAMVARAARAEVELFHAIDEPDPERSFPETATFQEVGMLRAAIVEKYARRLERFARDPALRGVRVRCTAAWDYPPHEAIIRRAVATHSDLVIAAARGHRFGARLVLRNTDWELIRHCPVPLLLIKSPRPYRRPLVLAAVDPFHRHERPANLDARLLQAGGELARLLHGRLEVFHAYMPLVSSEPRVVATAPPMIMPPEVEAAHEQQVARVVGALADNAGISRTRCHLRMGELTDQLATLARRSGTAVVVMGAVSRSALARFFIGSAAERALDHLGCDVLIVKPRGFRSAVQRQPQAAPARRARGASRPVRGRRKLAQTAGALPAVPPPFL